MKTKYISIACAALLLAGCGNDFPTRDESPASEGFFIYETTHTIVTYTPDDVATDSILIGRTSYLEAADLTLNIEVSDEGTISLPTTLHFAAGQQFDTVAVDITALPIGSTATLSLSIPKENATYYGRNAITISYTKDYNWESRGTVHFVSGFWNEEGDVEIEKAVEATDSLFRLVSPYFVIDSGEETEEGSGEKTGDGYSVLSGQHIKFILDADYNVVSLNGEQSDGAFAYSNFTGIVYGSYGDIYLYYTSEEPADCTFSNSGNVFSLSTYFIVEAGNFGAYTEQWTWTEGCPAALNPDSTDGDGTDTDSTDPDSTDTDSTDTDGTDGEGTEI